MEVELVTTRFNAKVRPLKNGDMIKIEAEIPHTDETWALVAPLALKRVRIALAEATQADIDDAEGEPGLDGIDGAEE